MALSYKCGTFSITSGNTAQAVSGVGFQPKVVILYWTRATANATATANNGGGFGVAVDTGGTPQRGTVSWYAVDNVGTEDSAMRKLANACYLNISNGGAGIGCQADMQSFDSDGFTIIKSNNDGTNLNIVHYVCLGGSDITNAYFGEFTGPATSSDKSYTGVGFQGDLGLFFGVCSQTAGSDNGTDYEFWIGAAKDASNQAGCAFMGDDGVTTGTNQSDSYISTTKLLPIVSGGGCLLAQHATFKTWDASDGFTLTHTNGEGIARVFFGLILKGAYQAAVGSQARTTSGAPVDQDVTSPGFQPSGLLLAGTFATANDTETTQGHMIIGAADGTDDQGTWCGDASTINTDCNMYSSSSKVYSQLTNPSTVAAQADASFISNGYRLGWTTTDANARRFWHLALASGASSLTPTVASAALTGVASMMDTGLFTRTTIRGQN